MNNWGYLILIAALLLLAAAMLYARFASRSREKSLHHAPVELMFPFETISAARAVENETGKINLPRAGAKAAPGMKVDRVSPPDGESKQRESDYFDELQEAAAGLAMLMRSSPVGRTEPVIFAPEEEVEAEVVDCEVAITVEEVVVAEEVTEIVELSLPEPVDAVLPLPGEERVEMTDETVAAETVVEFELAGEEPEDAVSEVEFVAEIVGEPLAETVAEIIEEESEVSLPAEIRVLTMREILGEQVSERIDQIDEGLDALEALVRSIESSLRALDSADLIDEDEETVDAGGAMVSEAA